MISCHVYRPRFYFSLTFLVTYALWFAGAYCSFREDLSRLYMLFMLPGLMAPFLISSGMVFSSKNRELRKEFVARIINFRLIDPKMLPAFFLLMPLTVLASILVSLPFGGSITQFRLAEGFSFSTGFLPVLLLLGLAACFEELGWRGYAFDSLQSRYNFLTASILFSILWSLWHVPLLFVKDSYQYQIVQESVWFGVNFFLSIIPLGIIISWFCVKNRKNVLAAILFHFMVNVSQEVLEMTQLTKSIETGLLTLAALLIVAGDRKLFFSKPRFAAS